jgi:hypothetical protein
MDRRLTGQNAFMPDVSIYVALIAAGAGVVGATIPQIAILVRDGRQAERDRRDRGAETRRQACLDLLRAAGELRTRVANAAEYHGTEMGARLAEIRESEAAVRLNAVSVALLVPRKLTEPAEELAEIARRLVAVTERDTDLDLGVRAGQPNFAELDRGVAAFRRAAVGAADAPDTADAAAE